MEHRKPAMFFGNLREFQNISRGARGEPQATAVKREWNRWQGEKETGL